VADPVRFLPGDAATEVALGNQDGVTIAPGTDASLAVWSDSRALAPIAYYEGETSRDIYGVRIDATGTLLDTVPICITAARATQENPKVAWNGTNWLVVFESYDLGGTGYYYQKSLAAVRVAPSGQVLDSQPIPIYGVTSTVWSWEVGSDGNNWVVVFEGSSSSYDIMAIRISPAGVVLDPANRSLVPATYYTRFNVQLAYAAGIFLVTYNDEWFNGTYDTKAVRFDSDLNLLDPAPISLLNAPLSKLTSKGTEFYAVWHQQQPDFTIAVTGSRINTAGQKLDGAGRNISENNEPGAYTTTSVVWDGTFWKITWGFNNAVQVARVNAAGQVLDPGGISVTGPETGPTVATSNGDIQLVWTSFGGNNYDAFTANVTAGNMAGPNQAVSVGAPSQLPADAATSGSGYMMVYASRTSSTIRILAMPLDAAGNALLAEPLQLDSGAYPNGPGTPAVAWNGSLYMVTWGKASGVVAQRILPSGTLVDPVPFVVMPPPNFGPADIAATGDTFLVVALQPGYNPAEIIFPVAVRVRGSDGVVLDPTPKVVGGSFTTKVKVASIGGRWIAAWQQNVTHDNPAANTYAAFVNADGTALPGFIVYGYSTAGGNAIFDIGLASSGSSALVVQSAEVTSGVETDLVARLVSPDGTMQPAINLTPWSGNQYRPRASWDGTRFLVAFQDQRNRITWWSLEPLDARGDLFGMRITPAGVIVDPQGFLFSASAIAETHPTVESASGVSLLAGSFMVNDAPYDNYRIGYTRFGLGANQWPVAVASAAPSEGDVPIMVSFSSAGSTDLDGSIAAYLWDFGDGYSSTAANPSHVYLTAGPFVATLTITDNGGAATTQTALVRATAPNRLPVAHATAAVGPAPLDVVFYGAGSYDPDGFLGNFMWTFGDGSFEYWGTIAYHTYTDPGTYPVTLTVWDSRQATGTTTLSITVTGPFGTQVFATGPAAGGSSRARRFTRQ
jgi:PKD repeat protein